MKRSPRHGVTKVQKQTSILLLKAIVLLIRIDLNQFNASWRQVQTVALSFVRHDLDVIA